MQWGIPQNIARIARGDHYRGESPAKRFISKRSIRGGVSPAAVDKAVSARGSYGGYRPHESPANHYITGSAGDAVGILLDVTPGDHTSYRSRSADFDYGPSKPPQTPL